MINYYAIIELCLFFVIVAIYLQGKKSYKLWSFFLFALSVGLLGWISGYPKSSYHLIIFLCSVGVLLQPTINARGALIARNSVIVAYATLFIVRLGVANIDNTDKINAYSMYYLVAFLLVLYKGEKKLLVILMLLIIDVLLAYYYHSRGVMISGLLMLFLLYVYKKSSAKGRYIMALSLLIGYIGAGLMMEDLFYSEIIKPTASNVERLWMNKISFYEVMTSPIRFSEESVYVMNISGQGEGNLSVHNLFLSFGLFNGYLVFIAFSLIMVYVIAGFKCNAYFVLALSFYVTMVLSPDSASARLGVYSVILLYLLDIYESSAQNDKLRVVTRD